MSFTIANWACVSTSLNQGQETVTPFGGSATVENAPNFFIYGSPTDSVATITGSGYFNDQYVSLCVGDWIVGNGSDGYFQVSVLSITAGVVVVSSVGTSISPFEVTGNFFVSPSQTGIIAHSGGGQASATPLTYQINNVTTVAASGDSVKLPASLVTGSSLSVTVMNNGANPMQVFGTGTDTINGAASGTGVSQLPGSVVVYTSPVLGSWYSSPGSNNTFATSTASATPGTIRALRGLNVGTATTMTSGNLVGVRGEVDYVGASGGFVYGTQGKIIPTGTLSGSSWNAGVFGQLDISAATVNAGQMAPIWGDYGSTSGTLTDQTGLYGIAMTNTTAAVLQGQLYLYGGAQNLMLLSTNAGLSGVTYFKDSGTGSGSWGNATPPTPSKVLKITVDGTAYYLPLVAQNT